MDLFPDAFVSLEAMRKGGWGQTERWAPLPSDCRRRSDAIIALGPCMEARLHRRGIPPERIHIADNWADGREIVAAAAGRSVADLHILYSGNLGLSHDIETIAGAMVALANDRRIPDSPSLEAACAAAELEAWSLQPLNGAMSRFLPYANRQERVLPASGNADIGLVTLKRGGASARWCRAKFTD